MSEKKEESKDESNDDNALPPNINIENDTTTNDVTILSSNINDNNDVTILSTKYNDTKNIKKILKKFGECYRYEMKCPWKGCETLTAFPDPKSFKKHYSSKHLTKQERLAKMLKCPIEGIDGKKCSKLSRNFSNLVNHMVCIIIYKYIFPFFVLYTKKYI